MWIAITRDVSDAIAHCELTHLQREPLDVGRARAQHAAYEAELRGLGVRVERATAVHDMADAVFVEDVAVVVKEGAIMTRPGAASRRGEGAGVAEVLSRHRRIVAMTGGPTGRGTLDGGDVLRIGKRLYVGTTSRTNLEGIEELRGFLSPHGYEVIAVVVRGCLHLKSAVTQVGESMVLLNPQWVDRAVFVGMDCIDIDPREPWAANGLLVDATLIFPEHFPLTRARLEARGISVLTVPCDELAKAEGAVTCCSILLEAETDVEYMRRNWRSLWDHVNVKGPALKPLLEMYRDPSRAYHDTAHIAACLRELRAYEAATGVPRQVTVELALYFHDGIYDAKASDNEAKSAALAGDMLSPVLPAEQVQRVKQLIIATDHRPMGHATADESLICDIDLAILGKPWKEFAAYEEAIRREYAHVPEDAFRKGRAAVLRRFLERERIFITTHFQQYEAAARVNLEWSIGRLK